MIKPFQQFSLLFFGILLLSSCDETNTRTLPRHSGEPGEILLVMNESKWLGTEGDSLRVVLEQYVQQLPQAEVLFSILQFSQREMSSLLEQHRNIVEIEIGPGAEGKNTVTLSKDKWSNDQLVFRAYATDREEWNKLLKTDFPRVVEMINDKEIDRLQKNLRRNGNKELEAKVKEQFGVEILLPLDCEVAIEKNNFIWMKRERVKYLGNTGHDITQGFMVYRYPYTGENDFMHDSLMATRDSILKKYVPGPKEGTYMSTEYRYPPESREVSIGGQYAVYTQGLWRTENYFMGGPFRRLATTSKVGNEMIVVSGFVFAPKFDKREYVRELDAVISSVKLSTPTAP